MTSKRRSLFLLNISTFKLIAKEEDVLFSLSKEYPLVIVNCFHLCFISVMKKIEFRATAIIRIQKTVKMFLAICRHKPR